MLEKGVMHALQKKYVKSITFFVTDPVLGPNGEENVLEEYVFKVRYGDGGDVAIDDINVRRSADDGASKKSEQTTVRVSRARRLDDEEYIKRAAANMVRSLCALIRTLEPMPEDRKFSMKLTYVDNTVRTKEEKKTQRTAGKSVL